MLKIIDKNTIILILFATIVLNYIFFLSPSLFFFTKIIFLIFIFFSIIYFYNNRENKFLFFFILILLIIAIGTPSTSWDARSIWLFKSKIIFYDKSILLFNGENAPFNNGNYPNIAPAFAASFVNLIGYWNEIYPKAGFTFMFVPPLILLNRFISNNYFLLSLILILFVIGKYFMNGELDGLVSIYFILCAFMFYNFNNNFKIPYTDYLIMILLNVILTLLKTEGSILLISLIIGSSIIFFNNKILLKKIILISLISFTPVLIWNIFCINNPLISSINNNSFTIENLTLRIFELKNYIIISKYLLLNEKFLISLLIFTFSLFFFKNKKIFFYVISSSFIYLILLYGIYLSTSLDLEWHLNSANRVIKPIALFFAIFGIYNLINKNKKIY